MEQPIPKKQRLTVIQNYVMWLPLTENWIYNQVKYLPDAVENHIICKSTMNLDHFSLPNIHCPSETSTWTYIRILTYGLRKLKLRFRRHSAFLLWIANHKNAIIMHSHFGYTGWRYMEAAKKAGVKHIVTFYGLDVSRFPQYPIWRKRYVNMFSQVDCVLCEGPYMAKSVRALGCPAGKVRVHHLGIEVDKIRFQPREWNTKEPLRVLIAASFREKKGIPYAVEALGRLQETVPVEITIVGDAGPDEMTQLEKQKIKAVIDRNGLAGKVRLLGYQPHTVMFEEAYKHHIFLSPSVTAHDGDTEGGAPVSIIEMAASGMPVVSTKHCDIPEVIQHGVSGLLAEERDVGGLVEHLLWLIKKPRHWGAMVQAARKHIEAQYNVQVQGEKLATIYEEVAKS